MNGTLSTTGEYYAGSGDGLGWELTLCNALAPEKSPARAILKKDDSYGHLLYDYLRRFLPMDEIEEVIEIGGGYGYLMRDFLLRKGSLKVTMLDISPHLSGIQRETLRGFAARFVVRDFLEADPALLCGKQLAILNENLGDFPTAVGVSRDALHGPAGALSDPASRVRGLFDRYALEEPSKDLFNMNVGALEALERLCASGIPYIFLSEHSCEARVPEPYRGLMHIPSSEDPERIALKGHDEYTIKFSHLEKVAAAFHYQSVRGPLADYIEVDFTEKTRFILASKTALSDEDEIIRHFVEDLYKYEYLILIKARDESVRDPI